MYIKIFGRNVHLFHIALIGFILFAAVYVTKGSIESAYIAKNGIMTKGVITAIKRSGSKGVEDYYYKFIYNENVYFNSTIHLSKDIGDSVNVLFIKNKPSENKLEEQLEDSYGYFLRRNTYLKKEVK